MKFKIKKRIFISNNFINYDTIGIIFISNTYNQLSKKKINLNKTKLYYKTNVIQLFKQTNINKILSYLNIFPTEIINIYKDKLYIIVIDKLYKMDDFNVYTFLDLYIPKSLSIYNDIYNYNKFDTNNYLNILIKDDTNKYSLKLIDIYYYLIGYI